MIYINHWIVWTILLYGVLSALYCYYKIGYRERDGIPFIILMFTGWLIFPFMICLFGKKIFIARRWDSRLWEKTKKYEE